MQKEFEIECLANVRDILIFCCFTGLAFSDVKTLSKEHLVTDNEGTLWIRKQRIKTNNMCNIPNAITERVNGILKIEWIDSKHLKSWEEAQSYVKHVIELYNNERPHQSIS